MSLFAIIAEYNPFTLGHEYHIHKTREVCNADYLVGIMSGPFVQRGEPAVADKYVRADTAVACGLDAVIELPCVYASSNAEQFARGAVRVAAAMGADGICCGCEHEDISVINMLAQLSLNEPKELSDAVKNELSSPKSFAAARAAAYAQWCARSTDYSCEYIEYVLTQPNSILAIEYKKAINIFAPEMKLKLIKRIGSNYTNTDMRTPLPSASAARTAMLAGESFEAALPESSCTAIKSEIANGNAPVSLESLEQAILYRIRTMSVSELDALYDYSASMSALIKNAAHESCSINEAIHSCVNKTYSAARIRRAFIAALLGYTKALAEQCKQTPVPLHILAARNNGVLAVLNERSKSPVITRANQFPTDNCIFTFDLRAQSTYSLTQSGSRRTAVRDFKHKLELYTP